MLLLSQCKYVCSGFVSNRFLGFFLFESYSNEKHLFVLDKILYPHLAIYSSYYKGTESNICSLTKFHWLRQSATKVFRHFAF